MQIGIDSYISPTAKIVGYTSSNPKSFILGDHCYIGDDVQIICDDFKLGDYGKIHHHCNIHGNKVHIGHNAWVGQYCILDGLGGITIEDNCGIGIQSLLYSHGKYGDTLEGCRFDSISPLIIGKDVWLAGGNITVQPVTIQDKVMVLAGAVITKDLETNHVYAGVPAKDITSSFGPQFLPVDIETKYQKMLSYLEQYTFPKSSIEIVKEFPVKLNSEITYFNISTRTYTKKNSVEEIGFIKFLLPSKAKFTPYV